MVDSESNTTGLPIMPAYFDQTVFNVGLWSNTFIFLLGLITNPLTIFILSKKQIGSSATRILLLALALADLGSILAAIFINYIPYYWQWFNVFSNDFSCGVANTLHGTLNTLSSWYLVMLCSDRLAALFTTPQKYRTLFSASTTAVACALVAVICLAIFSIYILFMGTIPDPATGYIQCVPKKFVSESIEVGHIFKIMIQVWVYLYMFIPAVLVVLINAVLVGKLYRMGKLSEILQLDGQDRSNAATKHDKKKKLLGDTSSSSGIDEMRSCTRLVLISSVIFAALVVPRGISVTKFLDANWTYSSKAEYQFDVFSYILQYLSHSTKLIVFMMTSKQFSLRNTQKEHVK